jgi:hypothetical protein
MAQENNTAGTVEIEIMNRGGHDVRIVVYDEVSDLVRDEMSQGKWVNVHYKNGRKDDTFMTFEDLEREVLRQQNRLNNAQKIQLIAALTGGEG